VRLGRDLVNAAAARLSHWLGAMRRRDGMRERMRTVRHRYP